eukprot:15187216-Heterocapsa_arctica.AAC.1
MRAVHVKRTQTGSKKCNPGTRWVTTKWRHKGPNQEVITMTKQAKFLKHTRPNNRCWLSGTGHLRRHEKSAKKEQYSCILKRPETD